jgi:hypothetical protein
VPSRAIRVFLVIAILTCITSISGRAQLDYLRCDAFFTDPNDPGTPISLRNCAQLR